MNDLPSRLSAQRLRKCRTAFTLIELVVVIVILGNLAAIAAAKLVNELLAPVSTSCTSD